MPKVLVVDDEPPIVELVTGYLEREGWSVASAGDGLEALDAVRLLDPDVVVLDVMLPGLDGVEVCRQLRAFSDAYVLMLTARGEEIDRIMGLTVGADDYLTQPGKRTRYDALVDYGLDDFYWRGVASIYGYESSSPSVDDLVLWIFRKAIEGFKSDRPGGLQNIQLDFASLRNDRRSQEALATLAKRAARDLDYASTIEDASFRDLVSVDLFEETDQKIISDLARAVAEQTVTAREVAEVVRARQSSVWIDGYKQLYTAIASASELLTELASLDLAAQSFDEALERYRREWFRIDQLYRQFIYAARTAEYPKPLEALREQVEKRYTNKFVYELGNAWQQKVDAGGQVDLVRTSSASLLLSPTTSSRWCATATRRPSSSSPTRFATRWPRSSALASVRRIVSTPRSMRSSACCRATRNWEWQRCFRIRR